MPKTVDQPASRAAVALDPLVRRFMKQFETISAALSDASAVLQECSNTEDAKLPRLTIMTPYRVGYPDQKDDPPMSVKLNCSEVRALYDFLHGYYSANAEVSRERPTRVG